MVYLEVANGQKTFKTKGRKRNKNKEKIYKKRYEDGGHRGRNSDEICKTR